MKKILSTLYIILACATPAIAQVKVSISELVGNMQLHNCSSGTTA